MPIVEEGAKKKRKISRSERHTDVGYQRTRGVGPGGERPLRSRRVRAPQGLGEEKGGRVGGFSFVVQRGEDREVKKRERWKFFAPKGKKGGVQSRKGGTKEKIDDLFPILRTKPSISWGGGEKEGLPRRGWRGEAGKLTELLVTISIFFQEGEGWTGGREGRGD